jgi:hypothetical protein
MNREEIKIFLSSAIKSYYFKVPLPGEAYVIKRRSFNDLVEKLNCDEKDLMSVIKELEICAYYCDIPHRPVFHKVTKPNNKFWKNCIDRSIAFEKSREDISNCGKYTPKYLEELYDSV